MFGGELFKKFSNLRTTLTIPSIGGEFQIDAVLGVTACITSPLFSSEQARWKKEEESADR
jgi:hypothetical protein